MHSGGADVGIGSPGVRFRSVVHPRARTGSSPSPVGMAPSFLGSFPRESVKWSTVFDPTMGVPTYSVRFESQDDFLVEYTDRLRHGQALLPLGKLLPPGTPVRLKVELPEGSVLYLLGSAVAPTRRERTDGRTTLVRLAITDDQRAQLEACVQGL